MRVLIKRLFFGILAVLFITSIVNYYLQSQQRLKSIIDNENIIWNLGWNDYTSHYSGSELSFLLTDSDSINIEIQRLTKSDQGLEVLIDGKKVDPVESENNNNLSYKITQDEHEIRIRYFCTHFIDPCGLVFSNIYVDHDAKIRPSINDRKVISFLGDSISTIYGQSNYTFLLTEKIGYQLHNASIHGSSVTGIEGHDNATLRYQKDLEKFPSDIVVIFLGTNDAAYGVEIDTFKNYYSTIVEDVKNWHPNSRVFLSGILRRSDIKDEVIQEYNEVIRNISISESVNYLDTMNWLQAKDFSDAIHPSIQSQEKLAESFRSALFEN